MVGSTAAAPASATPLAGGRKRGGGKAPAIDPRTVTEFDEITAIPFVFARHHIYPEAHVHMNSICSDAFLDIDDLFTVTDRPTRVTFVPDHVAIITNKIQEESVAPNAFNTMDLTAIAPLWARCSFSISSGARCKARRFTPAGNSKRSIAASHCLL